MMKRAESYYTMAADMRHEIANVLFNPTVVSNAIHEVAALGHRSYRIVQEDPFDLSDTEAAQALELWLDQEEFRYVWRSTYIDTDPFRPGQTTEYPELVIYW
jgi:hypothetical protein